MLVPPPVSPLCAGAGQSAERARGCEHQASWRARGYGGPVVIGGGHEQSQGVPDVAWRGGVGGVLRAGDLLAVVALAVALLPLVAVCDRSGFAGC